jgi:hypothetical protein
MNTRRQFLIFAPLGALSAVAGAHAGEETASPPPGAPPAFGTAPPVGPEVTPTTFAEAEKLLQVSMVPAEREMAALSWRRTLASVYERRNGPRKVAIESTIAPATQWNPVMAGMTAGPDRDRFVRSDGDPGRLPTSDAEIAFATVSTLSRWIETRKLTSD